MWLDLVYSKILQFILHICEGTTLNPSQKGCHNQKYCLGSHFFLARNRTSSDSLSSLLSETGITLKPTKDGSRGLVSSDNSRHTETTQLITGMQLSKG